MLPAAIFAGQLIPFELLLSPGDYYKRRRNVIMLFKDIT